MSLTKKDKTEVRTIIKEEIIDAISEVVIPSVDGVYRELRNFEAKTESNFSDLRRQIRDISLDTPTRSEFMKHDKRIKRVEYELGFV